MRYALIGMHNGRRLYRHGYGRDQECSCQPPPRIDAYHVEEEVTSHLFAMLGNPAQIDRAIRAGIPDCDSSLKRRDRLKADIEGIEKARERILSLVIKEALTMEQAEKQLADLKEREGMLRQEVSKLDATLADVPDEEAIRVYVEKAGDMIFLHDDNEDGEYLGGTDLATWLSMTKEDKQRLIRAVFDTTLADGSPAGVYVYPDGDHKARQRNKKWIFKIRGRIEFESVLHSVRSSRTTSSPWPSPGSSSMNIPLRPGAPRVDSLFTQFQPPGVGKPDDLPRFEFVPPEAVPEPYHGLLVHEHHMTVTVEAHHGSLVDVRILARRHEGDTYSRKILLALQSTGRVVQFGIVRIDLGQVSREVREALVAGRTPVGRILIEHGVLRRVEPRAFLRIDPGPRQWAWFGLEPRPGVPMYGRLVIIYCNNRPALEALEVVVPE